MRIYKDRVAKLLNKCKSSNLSDDSVFSICKKIRQESVIPILFISARQSDDDILIALNIGGDDYIKKPYSLSVLLAKVKVIIKCMVNKNTGTVR